MTIQTLTSFFMWCTIINGGILLLWTSIFMLMPDLVYRLQSRWFPISRDNFNIIFYSFLGLFKLMFLVFNVTPFIALLIIS